ncbi:MAG: complex I NDUFA9 subunit family protein [Methylophilaceae bacterium]|nr:complex I NDUFA9 subunit family protein [Methylophilaceae bacterium]
MKVKQIAVLGGAGFLGSALVAQLSAAGYAVKVMTRRRESAKHLLLLPTVKVVQTDVLNTASLRKELQGCDAVVNLIGILHQSKKISFERMHHQFPKQVAKLCAELNIPRLLHVSALGVSSNAPSLYLQSKYAGEQAVIKHLGAKATIFRPSVIFGRGDSFINLFAKLVKLMPVVMLAKPNCRFQPVFVEDVVKVMLASVEDSTSAGKCYELAGPKVYRLRELVSVVAQAVGKRPMIVGLNDTLSYMQAFFMEWLPVKLMTRDNVRSMEVDNVSPQPLPFGIRATPLEAVMTDFLNGQNPRNQYNQLRVTAGR